MAQQKKRNTPGQFGKLLRFYRERAGISLNELARLIPLDQGLLSRVERGLRPPPQAIYLRRVGDVLGLAPDSKEFKRLMEVAVAESIGKTQGRRLLVLMGFDAEGKPVIQDTGVRTPGLHGLPGTIEDVDPLLATLTSAGFEVTQYERRGDTTSIEARLHGKNYAINIKEREAASGSPKHQRQDR